MQAEQLDKDKFLQILWDANTRIIGIDWRETTSSMSDKEFKAELTLFAEQVEQKKARGILADVSGFRHQPGPDIQPWRVKNISNRYSAAGVGRFAFLFPVSAQIPPMMNQFAGREFSHPSVHRQERSRCVVESGGYRSGNDPPKIP